jgi:CDP-diacylglycerol---glycerol-3-phosphate 3-phosphatidyltransferase
VNGTPPLRRLADLLTLARAVLGLPLLLALAGARPALAWVLLLLGGLSDWADGALARRAGGGSVWGARLDPLTDKILISAPLLWLAHTGGLPLWAVWLLLARELLLWPPAWGLGLGGALVPLLHGAGWWLFWPSLLLALSSALGYLRAAPRG